MMPLVVFCVAGSAIAFALGALFIVKDTLRCSHFWSPRRLLFARKWGDYGWNIYIRRCNKCGDVELFAKDIEP